MPTIDQRSVGEARPAPEDWAYLFIEKLNGGLNVSKRPELIADDELVQAKNVRFERDQVLVDYGYKTFAQVIRGNPRTSFQFFLSNGSSILTLITNATFYRWDSTAEEWQYVSDGVSTTLSGNEAAGQTVLSVTSETGFSSSDFVGITLNDGTQHRTTVASTAVGTITVDDALPSAADSGKAVVKAVDLSGDDDITPSITVWPAYDKMYFANGVDAPKEFDGTTVEDISNLPASGNFSCRVIVVFNNHLMMMYTSESGTDKPQRVRWGEPGSDSNFNESVNFVDLYDTEDFITASEALGSYQVIYKERSIYRVEYLGLDDQSFNFVKTISAEGAPNSECVLDLEDRHLVFGNSNFYIYDGGFSVNFVGDNIFYKIFAQSGQLNPGYVSRCFGFYVEELDEAWFFYPSGSDEFPKNLVKYKISTGAWSEREFGVAFSGYGFFRRQGDITWQNAQGTWAEYVGPWKSKLVQDNSPTIQLLSKDDLRVYEYDYVTGQDNGTDISYELETKDFYIANWELRFDRYEFRLKGNNILIEVSYNEGTSWETLGTKSPGANFTRVRLHKQKIARSIRFRFTGSGVFGLEWIGVRYKAESVQRH